MGQIPLTILRMEAVGRDLRSNDMEFDIEILNNCKKILAETGSIESVLKYLREKGYSKTQSMDMLMELKSIKLGDAKKNVHMSKTWADTREQDDEFHRVIVEEFEKEGESDN
jgi:hypothetical protein